MLRRGIRKFVTTELPRDYVRKAITNMDRRQ